MPLVQLFLIAQLTGGGPVATHDHAFVLGCKRIGDLRGRVWPIAGLKEKLLAALRGGIKTVLIPEENAKDLVEIADSIKSGLEIVPVSRMDEVLARAMTRKPEPIEWDETTSTATAVREEAPVEEEASTLTAH